MAYEVADLSSGEGILHPLILQGDSIIILHLTVLHPIIMLDLITMLHTSNCRTLSSCCTSLFWIIILYLTVPIMLMLHFITMPIMLQHLSSYCCNIMLLPLTLCCSMHLTAQCCCIHHIMLHPFGVFNTPMLTQHVAPTGYSKSVPNLVNILDRTHL